jgi:hypothetical protein
MGVVFGLFSAFYLWYDFLAGIRYPNWLGKLHFWFSFIGVNLVFFPMHFLGLAGMPRRIPDYPDIYASWNFVCTVGYLITIIGIAIFILLLIYPLLVLNYDQKYKNNYYVLIANPHTVVHTFFFKIARFISSRFPWTYAVFSFITVSDVFYYTSIRVINGLLGLLPGYNKIPALKGYNGAKKISFYPAYNFFNTMQNFSTSYNSYDRILLLFFFRNFKEVWESDSFMKFFFEDLQKQNADKLFNLSYNFNFISLHNYFFLCFIFVLHNWFLFLVYIFCYAEDKIPYFFNVLFLNVVINKFVLGLGDSSFAYLAKKLNHTTKLLNIPIRKGHIKLVYDLNG